MELHGVYAEQSKGHHLHDNISVTPGVEQCGTLTKHRKVTSNQDIEGQRRYPRSNIKGSITLSRMGSV